MSTNTSSKNWPEERVASLLEVIGDERPVSEKAVKAAATMLDATERSISSKLRKLGHEVVSLAKSRSSSFSESETSELADFLNVNEGELTYGEIAEKFNGGSFSAKQIQGKILSMELTGAVKPTEQVVAASSYSAEQEATFIAMANAGSSLEEIAEAVDHKLQSARGKALSLLT